MQLQKRMQRMPEFVQRTVYDSSCEANISDSKVLYSALARIVKGAEIM